MPPSVRFARPLGSESRLRFVLLAVLVVASPHASLAQDAMRDTVVVSGVVSNAQGQRVARALVVLTRPPEMASQSLTTDSSGHFSFRERRGTGEFLLAVRAAGYRPVGRRVVVTPDERQTATPVTLARFDGGSATTLDAVKVVATKDAPPPSTYASFGVRPGAVEGLADGAHAGQSAVSTAPLDLVQTSLLGAPDAQGLSVAGLSGRESQTELNGLSFRGAMVPTSLPKRVQVSTGPYDIASGGYSGGTVTVEIPQAGEFRTVRTEVIASDGASGARRAASAGATPYTAVDWGGDWRTRSGRGGATFGLRLAWQEHATTTLSAVSDTALGALGARPDVARAADEFMRQSLLGRHQVPTPSSTGYSVAALMRIDPRIAPDRTSAFTLGITRSSQPQGSWSPLSVLPGTRRDDITDVLVQWQRSAAGPGDARWETRVGLSASSATSTPTASGLADLRVTTVAAPGEATYGAPIRLGGAAGPTERQRALGEAQVERLAFAGRRRNHTIKLIGAGRLDHVRLAQPALQSTAQFGSLSGLRALAPEQIEVLAQGAEQQATVARASAGIGDDWRLAPGKHLQYGLRGDVTWPGAGAERGRRQPLIATLSPRVGFSWTLQPPKSGEGFTTSTLFSRHLLAAGVLRLGAGIFHRDLAPDDILGLGDDGRSTSRRCLEPGTLAAVDAITPADLDDACVASGTAVSETATSRLADRYVPPYSIRSTASYTATWRRAEIQGITLWNVTNRQSQAVDVSVSASPLQQLAGEGNRPVYAPGAAINAGTGIVDRSLTTATPGARTTELQSNLSTRTVQGMLQLSPRWNDGGKALRLGYVWTRSQSRVSGWSAAAIGNVSAQRWEPNARAPEHTVQLEAGKAFRMLNVTAWVRGTSGLPFAPLVLGDVNGDGRSGNDIAYVPTTPAASPALWQQLGTFARTASPAARRCLDEVRTGASSAPCRTPWGMESRLAASVDLGDVGLRSEAIIMLQVDNLGALAGAAAGIPLERGWGQPNTVDRTLLRPVAFDRDAGRFAYAINPAFARRPGAGADGYRVTLSARIPLSPPVQRQQVTRWLAARGVGSRLPPDTLAHRFARNVPALYDAILEAADDLALEQQQREMMNARRARFERETGSIWSGMAARLAALPRNFDVDRATALVQRATDDAWEASRLEAHALRDVFSPIQRELLPGSVRLLMNATTPIKQRIVYH